MPLPLENFFMKSLQFYPNFISQPLNFSQSALNKTTEFIAKYQHRCQLLQAAKPYDSTILDENSNKNYSHTNERKFKESKKIEKVVENLRSTNATKPSLSAAALNMQLKVSHPPRTSLGFYPQSFPQPHHYFMPTDELSTNSVALSEESSHPPAPSYSPPENRSTSESLLSDKTNLAAAISKTQNAKLYATCFICHKQLSNQYNLRVHLETHQNVRYACNVCSHVSRSKDALRKHVSYRHPGAPSPCESETRRKRTKPHHSPSNLTKEKNQLQPPNGSPQSTSEPNTTEIPSPTEGTNVKDESPGL